MDVKKIIYIFFTVLHSALSYSISLPSYRTRLKDVIIRITLQKNTEESASVTFERKNTNDLLITFLEKDNPFFTILKNANIVDDQLMLIKLDNIQLNTLKQVILKSLETPKNAGIVTKNLQKNQWLKSSSNIQKETEKQIENLATATNALVENLLLKKANDIPQDVVNLIKNITSLKQDIANFSPTETVVEEGKQYQKPDSRLNYINKKIDFTTKILTQYAKRTPDEDKFVNLIQNVPANKLYRDFYQALASLGSLLGFYLDPIDTSFDWSKFWQHTGYTVGGASLMGLIGWGIYKSGQASTASQLKKR